MFSPSDELIIFVSTNCSFVKITLYCLNPNFLLNFCVAVVPQSMITLAANPLHIKVLLGCFFWFIYCFYIFWSEWYFVVIFRKILWSKLWHQYGITIWHLQYGIIVCYCFYVIRLSAYINHIYIVCSKEVSGFSYFFIHPIFFFNFFYS